MSERPKQLGAENLAAVLRSLNMAVYITDLDRRIVLWNRKAEEITGYKAEDIVGSACHDNILNHVDKHGRRLCTTNLCPLYRAIHLNKESREPIIVYAKTRDGKRVAVSVMTAPLRDEEGRVIGGVETFREETARMHDLEFARRIQRALLPETMPSPPGYEFEARYYPHDLIGGDFYDVRQLDASRYALFLADVRGHGVSAALYTMSLKNLSDRCGDMAADPEKFLSAVNRELGRVTVDESFATAFYGLLDSATGALQYCNAGHPPPLHYRAATGEVTELASHGLPLGIVEDEIGENDSVTLAKGDLVLLYTDGLTEAADRAGRMIGVETLIAMLKKEMGRPGPRMLERLYRRVEEACGEVSFDDDITLVSVRAI